MVVISRWGEPQTDSDTVTKVVTKYVTRHITRSTSKEVKVTVPATEITYIPRIRKVRTVWVTRWITIDVTHWITRPITRYITQVVRRITKIVDKPFNQHGFTVGKAPGVKAPIVRSSWAPTRPGKFAKPQPRRVPIKEVW